MIDLPDHKFWMPERPAIIRPAGDLWTPKKSNLPGMVPTIITSGAAPFAVEYTDNAHSNIGSKTFSWTNRSFGAADSTRLMVLAVHAARSGAPTLTAASIGGVAATIAAQSLGNNTMVALCIAAVPTGATGTVSATWNASPQRGGFALWRMVNAASATAHDSASPAGGGNATRSATINVPAGGVAIAAATGDQAAATTWTNVDEDYDYLGANDNDSGGHRIYASAQSGLIISATTARCICAASWG